MLVPAWPAFIILKTPLFFNFPIYIPNIPQTGDVFECIYSTITGNHLGLRVGNVVGELKGDSFEHRIISTGEDQGT
jgi:hypothetical protein